jgi:hypothetical protein
MYISMPIYNVLGLVVVILSFSLPYIVGLSHHGIFKSIKRSIGFGFRKCLQISILLSTSLILYWGVSVGVSFGVDSLVKNGVPLPFYICLKLFLDILLIPFAIFVFTRCYFRWLERG